MIATSVETRVPIQQRTLLQQSLTVVWRNLLHIRRMPEMLLDVTIQPVMFVSRGPPCWSGEASRA
jgi:hypothetical protein